MNNFKLKIKHLILMILVSSISFACLTLIYSLSDINNLNYYDLIKSTLQENNINYLKLSKTFVTYDEYSEISKDYSFYPAYDTNGLDIEYKTDNSIALHDLIMEYNTEMFNEYSLELSSGRVPEADDEILINDTLLYIYMLQGFSGKSVSNVQDILGEKIEINNHEFKIVGLVKSHYDFKKFCHDYSKENVKNYDFDEIIFLNNSFFLRNDFIQFRKLYDIELYFDDDIVYDNLEFTDIVNDDNIMYFDSERSLSENECILSAYSIKNYFPSYIRKKIDAITIELINNYAKENYENYYFSDCKKYVDYILKNEVNRFDPSKSYNNFYFEAVKSILDEINDFSIKFTYNDFKYNIKIVGISFNQNLNYLSNDLFNEINDDSNQCGYSVLFSTYNNRYEEMVSFSENKNFEISNYVKRELDNSLEIMKITKNILDYLTLVLMALSFFMIFSFSVFIVDEDKKVLSIYRAIGIKNSDIWKIYAFQNIIIYTSIFSISLLIYLLITPLINDIIFNVEIFNLKLLFVSPLYIFYLFLILLTFYIISTILTSKKVDIKL